MLRILCVFDAYAAIMKHDKKWKCTLKFSNIFFNYNLFASKHIVLYLLIYILSLNLIARLIDIYIYISLFGKYSQILV